MLDPQSLIILERALSGQIIQFHRTYTKLYDQIVEITSWLPTSTPPLERAYCVVNSLTSIQQCRFCSNSVKWAPTKKKYTNTCGDPKCRAKSTSEALLQRQRSPEQQQIISDKARATIVAKYGTYEAYIESITAAKDSTMVERYGVKHTGSSLELRNKMIATTRATYGVDNVLMLDNIRDQIKQTNVDKYGNQWHQQSDIGTAVRINTMQEKHGVDYPLQSPTIRSSGVKTLVDKYGTSNLSHINQSKRIATTRLRYGADNYKQSHISHDSLRLLDDREWLIDQHHVQQKTLVTIAQQLFVDPKTVGARLQQHQVEVKRFGSSTGERQLVDWLRSMGIVVDVRVRTLISPYELDVVIPSHNLAIEYCGLYWHSDIHPRINSTYHAHKVDMCTQRGYQLLTMFEDEWIDRQPIVKAKIMSLLGIASQHRVHARKCTVRPISTADARTFYDATHIQGYGRGSIRYGLYHQDQLVAAMSFINERNGVFQLNRFSTKQQIVGGFSKLLSHFKRTNAWSVILSYADRRWSTGRVYQTCGFDRVSVSKPSYWYLSKDKRARIHRSHFRHAKLSTVLAVYDPTLSEFDNCDINGVLRVWDCGLIRYEMCNGALTN